MASILGKRISITIKQRTKRMILGWLQTCCRLKVWRPIRESIVGGIFGGLEVWRAIRESLVGGSFGGLEVWRPYQGESCRWEVEENWRPSSFPLLPLPTAIVSSNQRWGKVSSWFS